MSPILHHNGEGEPALRLMAIFAHPDDEVFSCGGVMVMNRQRGIHNTLICATKGEAGEISLPELATSENLGLVREQELLDAVTHMGVDDLYFLGFRDSGMEDTADNFHPAAFANANASAVVTRLVRFIRTVRPQVIITFDPTGGYGHPDHIAIHQHTQTAFHAAADSAYAPCLGETWQAQRLFYPAFTRDIFDKLSAQMVAQGMEPPDWGIDETRITGQPIDASVDLGKVAATKWSAFKSHRTQFGPQHPFFVVPEEFIINLFGVEQFELAWPAKKPAEPFKDLFDGITA